LNPVEVCSRQSITSEGDDKHLPGYSDKVNSEEIPVLVKAFKDVEPIIEAAVACRFLEFLSMTL
jgi:hypothetical protein